MQAEKAEKMRQTSFRLTDEEHLALQLFLVRHRLKLTSWVRALIVKTMEETEAQEAGGQAKGPEGT